MADEEPARRIRIDPSDLLLEIISIVIAILLATAVGQVVDRVRANGRTHDALVQVCTEIAHDDASLAAHRGLHRRMRDSFVAAVDAARGNRMHADAYYAALARVTANGMQPFSGTTTAWNLAQTSDVLAAVPYALRAALQQRYAEIAALDATNAATIARIEASPTDADPNFYFVASTLRLQFADMIGSEERLAADDAAASRALRSAGDCP